jgi:hypothetical protein
MTARGDDIEVVIPPRSTAVLSGEQGTLARRDRHLRMITERGRLAWRKATDYGKRSLVGTTMGRYEALIGPRLRARDLAARRNAAAVGVVVLNQMLVSGRPDSVRRMRVIAWRIRMGHCGLSAACAPTPGNGRSSDAARG